MQIERNTKEQSNSKLWFQHREWRITASNFGTVVKATDRRDMAKLAETIFDQRFLSSDAIVHGKTYEKVAISKFEESFNVKVSQSGLFINQDFPFLAATPDGLVGASDIIEVKCPYRGRNSEIKPSEDFHFFLRMIKMKCI